MILKIQRPLNDPTAPYLLYDQSRGTQQFMRADNLPEKVVAALAIQPKVYWHARRDSTGKLTFKNQAHPQAW